MKKLFLTLFVASAALTLNAGKVVFIADGAQHLYNGDAEKVVVPVGSAGPLVGDFGEISFQTMFVYTGLFQLTMNSNVYVSPFEGVTVTDMIVRQSVAGTGKTAQCGLLKTAAYADATQTQTLTDISESMAFPVTNHHLRASWIEITYTGTPTQVAPVIFDSTYPIVPEGTKVKLSCSTPEAAIEYSYENAPSEWHTYTDGIEIKEEGVVFARAKKNGMTDSPETSASFAPIEGGLEKADFNFNLWSTLTPLTNGKSFVESQAKEINGMKWIYLSAEANTEGTEYKTFSFKSGDVTMTPFVGERVVAGKTNTRPCLCYDNTYGWTLGFRYYLGNVLTFEVPEDYEIKAAYFNGSNIAPLSDDYEPILTNCYSSPLFTVNDRTFWYKLTADSDNASPVRTMKFQSNGNKGAAFTSQCSHIYVYYKKTGQTGISENVAIDESAPVEYYNLQGIRVANPDKGLFIRRQGNKSEKILMK